MDIKKTPLYGEHKTLKAKFGPFGGWDMPISYSGIIDEHNWTRSSASIFDICHMGEFIINGPKVSLELNRIVTMNTEKQPVGSCKYGFMLNETGGIIDDLIVYRLEEDKFMMVVNAATTEKDFNNLKKNLPGEINLEDISAKTAKIDIQGPLSRNIIKNVLPVDVSDLGYYTFKTCEFLGQKNIISRTGYTGELGFEIYIDVEKACQLWNLLLEDNRVKPAGLGARDTLRLEMAYPLYGHELDDNISPLEAGLKMFVDFETDFIAKDKLIEKKTKGLEKSLVCFKVSGRRSPRAGYKIFKNDEEIGLVTSGSFSPSLGCGIGLGYVLREYKKTQEPVVIGDERVKLKAQIVKRPFYKEGSLKK
jgi:aminomethyltransferase